LKSEISKKDEVIAYYAQKEMREKRGENTKTTVTVIVVFILSANYASRKH